MPVPPVVPDSYLARSSGLFALCGGPLCGLYTDQKPTTYTLVIHLDYQDRRRKHWLCSYILDTWGPRAPRYQFLCMDPGAVGVKKPTRE